MEILKFMSIIFCLLFETEDVNLVDESYRRDFLALEATYLEVKELLFRKTYSSATACR
jgi:hypothetical protein